MSWQERLDDNQDSMVVCNIPESFTNASNYALLERTHQTVTVIIYTSIIRP